MYFQQSDHNPPHIHAVYGDYMGAIDIRTYKMFEGDLPIRVQSLVKEWLGLYHNELEEMWNTQQFRQLPPLQ